MKQMQHINSLAMAMHSIVPSTYSNKHPATVLGSFNTRFVPLEYFILVDFFSHLYCLSCLSMKPCIRLFHWPKEQHLIFDTLHRRKKNTIHKRSHLLLLKHSSCFTTGGAIFILQWKLYASKYLQEVIVLMWEES